MKNKYRIIGKKYYVYYDQGESVIQYEYILQIKYWWFPIWIDYPNINENVYNRHSTIKEAENYLNYIKLNNNCKKWFIVRYYE